jgi:hypothetical protein
MIKKCILLFFTSLLALASGLTYAVPPDFTSLTAAVDFSTVQSAIMTIFAALATVYILILGGRMILSRVKGR